MTPPLCHSQNPLIFHECPSYLLTLSKRGSRARCSKIKPALGTATQGRPGAATPATTTAATTLTGGEGTGRRTTAATTASTSTTRHHAGADITIIHTFPRTSTGATGGRAQGRGSPSPVRKRKKVREKERTCFFLKMY